MRRQPRHTTQPTCLGQRQTNVWTTSSKTNLTQSTSNSLRRNLSIMRTYCIKGSFGSSEMTIPQMCQTDCPVLTSRRLTQLKNALIDEWNNIPMRTVNALVNSIQRRIRAATAARRGHTRYWFSVWFWFQDLGGSYQWPSITRDLLITNQWNLELLFHTCTVL